MDGSVPLPGKINIWVLVGLHFRSDITKAEDGLSKPRLLKSGLMDAPLTGRVRVPE